MRIDIERYLGPELRPFGKLSNTLKVINRKHLEWIRSRPCIVSGDTKLTHSLYTIDAHHVRPRGQGQNDLLGVPLRHDLHMELGHIPEAEFEMKHSIDFKDALISQLVQRIIILEASVGQS